MELPVSLIETHTPPETGEADLLAKLQSRRPGAFEDLLELYEKPLYRFVYRLLEDPSEAPDVTQEVFIKVFRKVGDFRGECSLKTWLYRIASREASNCRRWFRRHRRLETGVDISEESSEHLHLDVFIDPGDSPFDLTYQQEQRTLIRAAMRKMDARLRLALVLRHSEELSYNEIADVMQVSLGTVKSRILRGREALRTALGRQLPNEAPDACALQTE
jgi:RNA polymerase sigma-70 factor, ECF subfamily